MSNMSKSELHTIYCRKCGYEAGEITDDTVILNLKVLVQKLGVKFPFAPFEWFLFDIERPGKFKAIKCANCENWVSILGEKKAK